MASGAGYSKRQLYTDADEVLFDGARPVILNGIEDIATRPDLVDRSIFLTLRPIKDETRREENELKAEFNEAHPHILGALLTAAAHGLKTFPRVKPKRLPRIADFAVWAMACEGALWRPGTFEKAYAANRATAMDSVIDACPVATALCAFMEGKEEWSGTATALLAILDNRATDADRRSRTWPRGARALSARIQEWHRRCDELG